VKRVLIICRQFVNKKKATLSVWHLREEFPPILLYLWVNEDRIGVSRWYHRQKGGRKYRMVRTCSYFVQRCGVLWGQFKRTQQTGNETRGRTDGQYSGVSAKFLT